MILILFFSVYSKTKAGVNSMAEDIDLSEEVGKASELIQEIFKCQTLAVPDDSGIVIERNSRALKLWVVQFFLDG